MWNPFKRDIKIVPSDQFSPTQIQVMRRNFETGGNAAGVLVLDRMVALEQDKSLRLSALHEKIKQALLQDQGPDGPDPWGEGYYAAIEDAIVIVGEVIREYDATI